MIQQRHEGVVQTLGIVLESVAALLAILGVMVFFGALAGPSLQEYSILGFLIWMGMRIRTSKRIPPPVVIVVGGLIATYPGAFRLMRLYEYEGHRPAFIQDWLRPQVPWFIYLMVGVTVVILGLAAARVGTSGPESAGS